MIGKPGRHAAVLVVDDDAWLRTLLGDLLQQEGYAVEQASNGYTAIRLAEQHRPDAILLDLALPEISGADVLKGLDQMPGTRDIPVIVVSGHLEGLTPDGYAKVEAVVPKPFDVETILWIVSRATRPSGSKPVSPTGSTDLASRANGRSRHAPARHLLSTPHTRLTARPIRAQHMIGNQEPGTF